MFHFHLSLCHALYLMSILVWHFLHCKRLRCIRSCTKYPSYGFLENKWFVQSRFMDLGNLFEVIVHYLLIRGMTGLGHHNRVPMISTLVYTATHKTRPTMSHDMRLLNSYDFTMLLSCIIPQSWKNIELVPKLVMTLTYGWDFKVIICSLWIRSLLMKFWNNRYSQ